MVHDPDTQHELLQAGRRRVLAVDSSKIGTEATYRICGIEDCDLILTDKGISAEDLDAIAPNYQGAGCRMTFNINVL